MDVYVGMGGNIDDAVASVRQAFDSIYEMPEVSYAKLSGLYRTTPVSPIPQPDFVNAVCTFKTDLAIPELFQRLQTIEKSIGKKPKHKDAPRVIDLDILFYGNETYQDSQVTVPHPRWKERLFVLVPLSDLIKEVSVGHERFDIPKMIAEFENVNEENVVLL